MVGNGDVVQLPFYGSVGHYMEEVPFPIYLRIGEEDVIRAVTSPSQSCFKRLCDQDMVGERNVGIFQNQDRAVSIPSAVRQLRQFLVERRPDAVPTQILDGVVITNEPGDGESTVMTAVYPGPMNEASESQGNAIDLCGSGASVPEWSVVAI